MCIANFASWVGHCGVYLLNLNTAIYIQRGHVLVVPRILDMSLPSGPSSMSFVNSLAGSLEKDTRVIRNAWGLHINY